jgi:hypothetical protein
MNKDLDERLIPQGEYKDAQNVTISRSEGDDVGTFQNILGNIELSDFGLTDSNLEVIGHISDEVNRFIYIFITNYNDSSNDRLSNRAPQASAHYIIRYSVATNSSIILVSGSFLNFSKTHRIYGINLLEDLLFWTDNRNQPRKINVTTAAADSSYYNSEDLISVAKFYPSNVPNFYKQVEAVADQVAVGPPPNVISLDNVISSESLGIEPGMQVVNMTDPSVMDGIGWWVVSIDSPSLGDVQLNQSPVGAFTQGDVLSFSKYGLKNCSEEFLPASFFTTLTGGPVTYTFVDTYTFPSVPALDDGYQVQALGEFSQFTDTDITWVVDNLNKGGSTLEVKDQSSAAVNANLNGAEIITSQANPNYDPNFTGDTEFLKDKFIRFAYRLKFDDQEYSLISPFTQIAFIPNQYGSFLPYDDERAATSSVLDFFENYINCIDLYFQTPLPANTTGDYNRLYTNWEQFINLFKVIEVDILCKFADQTSIQVIDTISSERVLNEFLERPPWLFKYTYRSTKPIKTLPENEITRVSDKVPIRALGQESAGNRIIYSNYVDKHTSPQFLNYNLTTQKKVDLPLSQDKRSLYNHSLKENRTYQVGIVLSDRYGRQSDVILSSVQDTVDDGTGTLFGASTIYHPFGDSQKFAASDILNFFGDQLLLYLQDPIPETYSTEGYPGLYNTENPLGWYSYKVVVKQQEQEYYNVYIPNAWRGNMTAGSPPKPIYDFNNKSSFFSLVNDNINKVPKDLTNVGPEEKEFRSSVKLFPRVNPTYKDPFGLPAAAQYPYVIFPKRRGNDVESIVYNASSDPNETETRTDIDVNELYKGKSAALAEVKNKQVFGTAESDLVVPDDFKTLGVYETNPFVSNLDIYYETSTSGFISELNEAINEDNVGPVKLTEDILAMSEATQPRNPLDVVNWPGEIIYTIQALNANGIPLNLTNCVIDSVYSTASPSFNAKDFFLVDGPVSGDYNLYIKYQNFPPIWYFYFGTGQTFTFTVTVTATVAAVDYTNTFSFSGNLSNINPQFNQSNFPAADGDLVPYQLEPYSIYTRETSNIPAQSLKPYYYTSPGDNDAAYGIDTDGNGVDGWFGALPSVYNLEFGQTEFDKYVPARYQGITDGDKTFKVFDPYYSGAPIAQGTWGSFASFNNNGPAFSGISIAQILFNEANYFTPGVPGYAMNNYPSGLASPSVLPAPKPWSWAQQTYIAPGKFFSKVDYTSRSGSYDDGWRIMEENQNINKLARGINGNVGFINGTWNTSSYQLDLTYSLSDLHFPKGNVAEIWSGRNGTRFADPDGILENALGVCVQIDANGTLSINDSLFWTYFGMNGGYASLLPDSLGWPFGGVFLNDELGHGAFLYGACWIGFTVNVEDAGGLITSAKCNIFISF